MKRGLLALASLAALAAAAIAYAAVTGPFPVKTTTANEMVPAANANWFAWSQSAAATPNKVSLLAEPFPLNNGDQFKVNRTGTQGWSGGIEGSTLVYQEVASGQSNIYFFDLVDRTRTTHPYVNTLQWEWHPTTSGDRILFGRQSRTTAAESVLLHNMTTHQTRTLASTTRSNYAFYPGQVNGNYAVFTACTPSCNVRLYNIGTQSLTTVPKPSNVAHQYAGSVAGDGTVYFAQSGSGCGVNVKISRFQSGVRTVLSPVSAGRDLNFTYTSAEADGNHVYYERANCSTGGGWNIYQLIDS
jgi:hypothetical protein